MPNKSNYTNSTDCNIHTYKRHSRQCVTIPKIFTKPNLKLSSGTNSFIPNPILFFFIPFFFILNPIFFIPIFFNSESDTFLIPHLFNTESDTFFYQIMKFLWAMIANNGAYLRSPRYHFVRYLKKFSFQFEL